MDYSKHYYSYLNKYYLFRKLKFYYTGTGISGSGSPPKRSIRLFWGAGLGACLGGSTLNPPKLK